MPALTETTLLKMVNKILNKLGEPIVTTIVGASSGKPIEIIDSLDTVRRIIINKFPWSWLEQDDVTILTVAGTRSYAIPETVKEKSVRRVKLLNHTVRGSVTQETNLSNVKYHDFSINRELSPETGFTPTATPTHWATFQDRIYLDAVPDDNGGTNYAILIQSGVNLSLLNSNTGALDDADELDVPTDFEDILLYGVLSDMLITTNPAASELYKGRHDARLGAMLDQHAAEANFATRLA